MDGGWQSKGAHEISWDGKDSAGKELQDGSYSFEVLAKNAKGASVSVDRYVSGEVTGVKYQNGEPVLLVGNRNIRQESIIEVTK
jgi:flagellar basal-body rod modification protein FlgD